MIKTLSNPALFRENIAQFSLEFSPADETELKTLIQIPSGFQASSAKRRAEFFAGRYALTQAFKKLGHPLSAAIESGADRAPILPEGLVGSLTHTRGFASAVVGFSRDLCGIGIDSEKVMSAKSSLSVKKAILLPEEINLYRVQFAHQIAEEIFSTLIFSAKECLFKALFPSVQRYFDFKAAEIKEIDWVEKIFCFELTADLSVRFSKGFNGLGRFEISNDLIHTGIEIKGFSD